MIAEFPYVVMIAGAVTIGLWMSNILYDQNIPHYISRKIGHSAGGLGFYIAVFAFSSAWWPIILTFSFGLLLLLAHFSRPRTFRGVGGSGRTGPSLSEVWFAWIAVPVFGIAWLLMNEPYLALTCLLYMAWGDCVTGLVRSQVYGKPVKGLWGSLAMLIVCLIISWAFIKPFWIGICGSVVATAAEWLFGDTGTIKWADDNLAVPVISLAAIIGISILTGQL
jgi:phytol kinase